MKKVVLSTYCHWTSFGSMLQSYGLQQTLMDLGLDVSVILFKTDEDAPAVANIPFSVNANYIQYLFKRIHRTELEESRRKSIDFIHNNISSVTYDSDRILFETPPDADVYIAGSDQIWNPLLCKRDVFLDYVPSSKKKISYAASMGTLNIPDQNVELFSSLIKNFDVISVREKEMISIICNYTDKPIHHNIDPTFLIPPNEWRKREKPYPIDGPYILVYPLYWDKSINSLLSKIHKKTGYPIVSIQNTIRSVYSNYTIYDAGPEEFLWLIDHAEGVVTSSFHGTAFSLIFGKRIYPVLNPNNPSRINNLLGVLNANRADSIEELLSYSVNSLDINTNICTETDRALTYLRNEILNDE